MSRDFFACRAFVVGEDVDFGIANKLPNPREAGADRLVNALAAVERHGAPLIIVDFGTATTFDIVDDEGAFWLHSESDDDRFKEPWRIGYPDEDYHADIEIRVVAKVVRDVRNHE